MTSSHGNISRVTGHLCGEFTGHIMCASTYHLPVFIIMHPRITKLWGGVYWFHSLRMSVRLSVRHACRVRFVTLTVLDVFFPYLAQQITSMRGCGTYNDP